MKKILISMLIILMFALAGCTSKVDRSKPYKISYNKSYKDYEITNPYELKYDEEIMDIYIKEIENIEKNKRDRIIETAEGNASFDYSKLKNTKYDLIFLDDDNIPELVVSEENSWVVIYTIKNGELILIGESADEPQLLTIGQNGNQSYEYIPKSGIIYNISTDYVGLVYHYNYQILNADMIFERLYTDDLFELHFEDINGNKKPDDDEKYSASMRYYYFGDSKLTEEEFLKYSIDGEYENLNGTKIADDMKYELEDLKK